MKYAVIRIGGKQYRVEEGKNFLVDKIKNSKDIKPEVLLLVDEKGSTPDTKKFGVGVKVGKPILKDVAVKIKVESELEKGKKLDIYKFKAKSRYKRHTGFRPQFTKLKVEKISL